METKVLEEIGLTKTEAKIYLSLLSIGSGTGSEIAEKADVFRRNAYDALNKLMEKGLVSSVIKDKTYYSVAPPEKLQDVLKEKEASLIEIMPVLREQYAHPKIRQKVFFYEGKEGIKTVMNEIIKEGRDWLAFASSGISVVALGKWVDYWEKRRANAGIKAKIIMADTPRGRARGAELKKLPLTTVKASPGEFETPVSTYVFGEKVGIVFWSETEPLAILIDSREIAAANRKYFNMMWKITKNY